MEIKARKLVFVGYSNQHKAYRFLDKSNDRIIISRDVKFMEDVTWDKEPSTKAAEPIKEQEEFVVELDPLQPTEAEGAENVSNYESAEDEADQEPDRSTTGPSGVPRRSTRGVIPARLNDYVLGLAAADCGGEPSTFEEATTCTEKDKWLEAINEEHKSLITNGTWELVDPPDDCNVIGCRWIFKKKLDAAGNIDRFKARLVAQGFGQRYGWDYDDVSAPVAMQSTLRVLLTIAGHQKLQVEHLDIKTAYLYGTLEEVIHMRQPQGFVVPGKEHQVCRLRKSMYGLKQAARVWYNTMTAILKDLGFEPCQGDTCLFRKRLENGLLMFLLLYVDDILIACKYGERIKEVEEALRRRLTVSTLGDISWFLGIQIMKDSDGFYTLSQEHFIKKIVSRFGLDGAKGSKYPMDTNYFKLRLDSEKLKDNANYQKLIGCLLYLSTHSRPDITACVGILSRCVSCPTITDWTEAKRVVRYLIYSIDYGLRLGTNNERELLLTGFCDADWAGDTGDRKSCSGFLYTLGGATVSWTSRKQGCVAMSTMEAEYIALSEAVQQAMWLRSLLEEMDQKQVRATVIFEDNRSCLDFVAQDHQKQRSKHIDTRLHYTKDLCASGKIKLKYCSTENMTADILTKPLGSLKMKKFALELGLVSISR